MLRRKVQTPYIFGQGPKVSRKGGTSCASASRDSVLASFYITLTQWFSTSLMLRERNPGSFLRKGCYWRWGRRVGALREDSRSPEKRRKPKTYVENLRV